MKEKKILVLDLSKDFWVEAEQSEDTYDFWLCRKNYGRKVYIIGELISFYKNLRVALEDHMDVFNDIDWMGCFLEELLEDEFVDELFNVHRG